MNKIKKFFWLCSGSHISTLEEVPSEGAKYVGIGATIFFTGIFAALAGGYAVYTFSNSYWISSLIGVVWGAMIFNLDRYIVSSMRKSYSWKREWTMATPRIILALVISLVIARPLELKIFEKEIGAELIVMNQEKLRANQDSIYNYYQALYEQEENYIQNLGVPMLALEAKRDSLRGEAAAEADGTGGTLQRNAGPIYQIKKANADKVEQEYEDLKRTTESLVAERRAYQQTLEKEKATQLAALAKPDYTGFAARLEALGRLTTNSYSIWLANLFIILLFIAIETAPVIVKLISPKGPYDYKLESMEYQHELSWINNKTKLHAKVKKAASKLPNQEKNYVDDYLHSNLRYKKPAVE